MLLCLDLGNSQLFGGVYEKDRLLFQFRQDTQLIGKAGSLISVFEDVLRKNKMIPRQITQIAVSSVVPSLNAMLQEVCKNFFNIIPFFLDCHAEMNLTIDTDDPSVLGTDFIATGIGGVTRYPNQSLIIVDFGTATTFSVINEDAHLLGTVISAGLRLSMEALAKNAAQLYDVEIIKPDRVAGRITEQSIKSGLYYTQIGAIREIVAEASKENFKGVKPFVIGTGGFSELFRTEKIFDAVEPDLILEGLRLAFLMNH